MSDSLFKASSIVIKNDEKRIIDTNDIVSNRIRVLSEILEAQKLSAPEEDFADGFVEGIDGLQVERLLSDPEEEGFVQKSLPQIDTQKIIDEANAQAGDIIESANAEASQIVASANSEADGIRSDARASGYETGYNEGYAKAMEELEVMHRELEEKSRLMDEDYERRLSEMEPKFVETLTDIYTFVLGHDLTGETSIILHLLKDAIRNIEGSRNFLVHVSKDDYDAVAANKDALMQGLATNVTMEVIEDMSLSASECFVEAESGIFDCGLGTELELLKKELILLSYRKEN